MDPNKSIVATIVLTALLTRVYNNANSPTDCIGSAAAVLINENVTSPIQRSDAATIRGDRNGTVALTASKYTNRDLLATVLAINVRLHPGSRRAPPEAGKTTGTGDEERHCAAASEFCYPGSATGCTEIAPG